MFLCSNMCPQHDCFPCFHSKKNSERLEGLFHRRIFLSAVSARHVHKRSRDILLRKSKYAVMFYEQGTKWIANVRFTIYVLEQKNLSEALPLEMIFLNFMMLKIPYAVGRELLIFCFCLEDIQGEMSGRKRRNCLFSDEHFDKGCRSLKKQKSSKKVLLQLRNFCRMNSDKKSFQR